jgi:DNA-binding CsgD family transcriptional regulator
MDKIISNIVLAPTLSQTHEMFIGAIKHLGFDNALYGLMFKGPIGKRQSILYTNYEPQFFDAYQEYGNIYEDIAALWCYEKLTPLVWQSETYKDYLIEKNVSNEQMLEIEKLAVRLKIKYGITIPIHIDDSLVFGLGLCVRGLDPDLTEKVVTPNIGSVTKLAKVLSVKLMGDNFNLLASPPAISGIKLTQNELDYLQLKALGLNANIIASEMGKSNKTLEDYSRQVRNKLGAKTTGEAISRAIKIKLVSSSSEVGTIFT